jgi:hypothetical protein
MNNPIEKIVTHPGQAHADDVLSLACLLAVLGIQVPIFRRDPTEAELSDPAVLCIDVGGEHDTALGNYDHHQMERSNTKCALKLLVEDVETFPELQPLALMEWVDDVSFLDTQGPFAAAKKLECSPGAVFTLSSRVEFAVKKLVEKYSGEPPLSEDLAFMLCEMGHVLIEEAGAFQASYKMIKDCPVKQVAGVNVLFIDSDDVKAANKVRSDLLAEGTEVAISVCHDDRGEGWTLYRFADHPKVDFAKIKDHEAVLFSHPGGFIAKTETRVGLAVLGDLIKLSIS